MKEETIDYSILGDIEFQFTLENGNTLILSALISIRTDDKKSMPCLSLYENYGSLVGEKNIFMWDNDGYLYNTLYKKVLVPWVENNEISNPKQFSEVIVEGIHLDEFAKLKFIFDKAIQHGFFEELLNKTKENGE